MNFDAAKNHRRPDLESSLPLLKNCVKTTQPLLTHERNILRKS